VSKPKTAPKLLKEDGCALGRTQEQDGINLGNVKPLVEEVDGEENINLAVPQRVQCVATVSCSCFGRHCPGLNARFYETSSHVSSMIDADAEAQSSHRADVRHFVAQLFQDYARPRVVSGVQAIEGSKIVSATFPLNGF